MLENEQEFNWQAHQLIDSTIIKEQDPDQQVNLRKFLVAARNLAEQLVAYKGDEQPIVVFEREFQDLKFLTSKINNKQTLTNLLSNLKLLHEDWKSEIDRISAIIF